MSQKTYRIVIDGVKESAENLSSLGNVLDKVNQKLEQQIDAFNKEYQKSVEENKRKLQELNKEVKQQVDLEKAQQIVAEGNVSTYKKKQELLTALGKVIKNMTTNTEAEIKQQQALKAQYASLNQELKDFDASLGNHQRNVGNYESGVVSLQAQLKELEAQMANMLANGVDKNSAAFQELAKKAGTLKDAIGDAKEEVKRFASDTKGLDSVIQIAQTATAGFQLWKGAMSAFGMETENAEKAIQKLAGAMSIIQSLKTLQEVLNQGGTAAKLLQGAMKLLGVEFMNNAASSMKAAMANKELTAAEKAGAVASKSLSIALRAIPLMFLIGLIVDLVNHWEDFCGWLEKSGVDTKKLNDWLGKLGSGIKAVGRAITTYLVNAFGTFSEIVSKVFSGDFSGAYEAWKEGWKMFGKTYDAFVDEFNDSENKRQENMVKKQAATDAELLKKQIKRLEAEKGNQVKYTKEGQELYKKYYKKLEEAAKGDQDKLDEIANERLAYERECNEKSVESYKKALKEKEDAAKAAALEEERRTAELLKDENKYRSAYLNQYVYEAERAYNEEKELYELYKEGPLEKLKEQYNNVIDAHLRYYSLLSDKAIADKFNEAKDIMGDFAKDYQTWANKIGEIARYFVENGVFGNYLEGMTDAQKAFIVDIVQGLKELNDSANDVAKNLTKTFNFDKLSVTVRDMGKNVTDILNSFNHNELVKVSIFDKLFSPSKARKAEARNKQVIDSLKDQAKQQLDLLKDQMKVNIDYYKTQWGAESEKVNQEIEKYKKLIEELQKQLDNLGTSSSGGSSDEGGTSSNSKWLGGKKDPKIGAFLDQMAAEVSMFADSVFNPINDAFYAMLQFQLEEAEAALDKATEMHEQSLDRVEESKDRIQELNDEMREAEGANLEQLKAQQADELNLLAQREAEEKRAAKEKEKREKEVEQLNNKMRKNELKAQLAQTVVNVAQSVAKTYANYGWPLGGVFGAIIAALGAVQVATIQKQMSKFADGGILPSKYANGGVIDGKSHAQGGVKVFGGRVELEGNEMIVNKKDTNRYMDVLQKINRNDPSVRYLQGNHGTVHDKMKQKFADGGTLNYQGVNEAMQQADLAYAMRAAIEGIHPVVSVVDIAKGVKNVTSVRDMAGASSIF